MMNDIQEMFENQKESSQRAQKELLEEAKRAHISAMQQSLTERPKHKVKWEIERSLDRDYIIRLAYELGWLESKVQVKSYTIGMRTYYAIEPFEEDCHCPGLIKPPNDGE